MDIRGLSFFSLMLLFVVLLPSSLAGQVQQVTVNSEQEDTTVVVVRRSIFDVLSENEYGIGTVRVDQDSRIDSLLNRYAENAASRRILGYRIRIFNNNAQNAREVSLEVENNFREKYPEVSVYRSFAEPNFRVTVGDFRTKSEAEKFKREIEKDFTSTFIIQDNINFPPL